jgi:hypothetical protein
VQLIGKSNKNISLLHYAFKGPNIKLPPTMAKKKIPKNKEKIGEKKSRIRKNIKKIWEIKNEKKMIFSFTYHSLLTFPLL